MKKEKIYFWEKCNPVELYIWRNKKHFGRLLKYTSHCGTYGTRYSKWKYDFATGEFVFNTFEQIEKHKWSKEPEVKRISAIKLLKGTNNPDSPMWVEFQEAVKQTKERTNA